MYFRTLLHIWRLGDITYQPLLKALRFIYRHGQAEHSFETMKFYTAFLRGFLRNNWGKAVWFVGGKIERPAYLLFDASLEEKVRYMMKTPLEDMGNYDIRNVDVEPLLASYRAEARLIRGQLNIEPPIKGNVPVEPQEKYVTLANPLPWGGDQFLLHYEHAVLTPGDEYWKGGMITLFNVRIFNNSGQHLDTTDRYFLPARPHNL